MINKLRFGNGVLPIIVVVFSMVLNSCTNEFNEESTFENSEASALGEQGEELFEQVGNSNMEEIDDCNCEGKGLKLDKLSSIPNDYTGNFYVCYTDTCALEITGSAIKGKRANLNDDLEIYYHRNGQIKAVGRVWDGKTVGIWKFYYPNGQLSGQGGWIDNCQKGKWVEYYENGQVSMSVQYSDSDCAILNGKRTVYYENGQVWEVSQWSNSTPYGEHVTYHPNGQIKSKGTYENGKKSNDWKYFNKDGTPSDKEVF